MPPRRVHFALSLSICVFPVEASPSDIPTSPVYDVPEAPLFNSRIRLLNFPTALPLTVSGKASRVDHIALLGHTLCGSILVKNIAFEKKVSIRYTLDQWRSYHNVHAEWKCSEEEFLLGGPSLEQGLDRFDFKVDLHQEMKGIQEEDATPHILHFAVCYEVNGETHWDNNQNKNYCIQLVKALESPTVNDLLETAKKSHSLTNNFGLPIFPAKKKTYALSNGKDIHDRNISCLANNFHHSFFAPDLPRTVPTPVFSMMDRSLSDTRLDKNSSAIPMSSDAHSYGYLSSSPPLSSYRSFSPSLSASYYNMLSYSAPIPCRSPSFDENDCFRASSPQSVTM
jgi:hypothetical protein